MSAIYHHTKSCENEVLCITLPSATPTSTNFAKNVTVHATFVTKVQFTLYTQYLLIRTTVNFLVVMVLIFSQNFSSNGPYLVLDFCEFSDTGSPLLTRFSKETVF